MALNLQTNINKTRSFFLTQDTAAGDQLLGLQFGTTGGIPNFSTMAVTITGNPGNGVIVSESPQFVATELIVGGDAMISGLTANYFTLSTLNTQARGTSISYQPNPNTGITAIDNYYGPIGQGGFSFRCFDSNSALRSTIMDPFLTGIGRSGSVASIDQNGNIFNGGFIYSRIFNALSPPAAGFNNVLTIQDLSGAINLPRWILYKQGATLGGNVGSDLFLSAYSDAGSLVGTPLIFQRATGSLSTINAYAYPQTVLSTVGVANQQGFVINSNTPTVIFTQTNSNLIPSQLYLTDLNFDFTQISNPGASGAFLELGVRLGGNGAISYGTNFYVPVGGTTFTLPHHISQITPCGNSNQNIEVIAYLQGANLTVSTNIQTGQINYFKNIT